MRSLHSFLRKRKYELLLFALIQHLFIGIFLQDLPFYIRVVWPVNMLILGFASVGVFIDKGRWKTWIKNLLFFIVLALPIGLPFFGQYSFYFQMLNVLYVIFFGFIFFEIMRFLVRPSYVNSDIIIGAGCGYFLLIEISVFLLQFFYYQDHNSFKGINASGPATIYIDLVYFCSITVTSIGFGDITPNNYQTKLATAFFGIAGQFFSVVLFGILLSKFTSHTNKE